MTGGYFITGTDTGVGKTSATIALLRHFQRQGRTAVGMKPVAAGCVWRQGRWQNEDALLIQRYGSLALAYETINPYAYPLPVAPHLAGCDDAADLNVVLSRLRQLQAQADIVLVEGAGGWHAPVNASADICDLAKQLQLPVIIVVAIKLGCINHAKLTYQAVLHSGLRCAGWVAVCSDAAMLMPQQNIDTVKKALAAPLLGVLPYRQPVDFNFFAEQITDFY